MMSEVELRYYTYEWDKPFDPNEYRSPKAITLLYENFLRAERNLNRANDELAKLREQTQQEIAALKKTIGEREKDVALLQQELEGYRRRKWFPFILQLLAALSVGVGVNIITGQDNHRYGWLFVGLSILLEGVAFFSLKSEMDR